MNKADEGAINIFERKILRGIFGAIKEGGHWRRRYNNELYRLYGEPGFGLTYQSGTDSMDRTCGHAGGFRPSHTRARMTTVWSPESW
jgi:hypothetical protein